MDPAENLRMRCLDLALRTGSSHSTMIVEAAAKFEQFVRTGDVAKPDWVIIPEGQRA